MGWRAIFRRAAKEAAKDAKLDNGVSAVISLVVQCIVALLLWRLAGHLDVGARVATAAVPFLAYPLAFGVRSLMAPAAIAREALKASEAQRQQLAVELAAARAAAAPQVAPIDPDAIYQRGRIVGKVIAPRVQLFAGEATFDAITDTADLDRSIPFQYRENTLRLTSIVRSIGMKSVISSDGSRTLRDVIEGVTCQIL